MTAAHSPLDPEDEAMIRRLAEMDMLAAEKAHAVLMASEQPAEIATGLLAYQRAARSARQTLMLKARLKRMAVEITPLGSRQDPRAAEFEDRVAGYAHDLAIEARVEALQDAVGRVICAAAPDNPDFLDAVMAEHDALIDDEVERPDFLHHPLEAHILRHCEALGLPPDLSARWRDLPKPPPRAGPDAADEDPDAPAEPDPGRRESG